MVSLSNILCKLGLHKWKTEWRDLHANYSFGYSKKYLVCQRCRKEKYVELVIWETLPDP